MRLEPEIRTLLILAALFAGVAFLLGCEEIPPREPDLLDAIFGPVESFTTRRVPARDLLTQ